MFEIEGGTGAEIELRGPVGISFVGRPWFKLWFRRDSGPIGIRSVRGPVGI